MVRSTPSTADRLVSPPTWRRPSQDRERIIVAQHNVRRGHQVARSHPRLLRSLVILAFISPALALLGLFAYYPLVRGAVDAFYNDNGTTNTFAGVSNFRQVFENPTLRVAWVNIAEIALRWVVLELTVPLVVARALLSLRSERAQQLFRVAFVVPIVISVPITALVWETIYMPTGPLNAFLADVGLGSLRQLWLANPKIALFSIMGVGFPFVDGVGLLVYTGGLQAIPREVIEAAQLDGASKLVTFFRLELPLIAGQVRLMTVFALVNALTLFTPVLLLTNGGPGNATTVPGLALYDAAFYNNQFGLASAIGVSLFVVIMVLTVAALRFRVEMVRRGYRYIRN